MFRTSRNIGILAAIAAIGICNVAFAEEPVAAPAAPAVAGGSVHDQMVGRIGVGYLGTEGMLLGADTSTGGTPGDDEFPSSGSGSVSSAVNGVSVPVIGIRYWLDSFMGIDAGLGFAIESSSAKADPGGSVDGPSKTAFILHGGLPLAMYSEGHFSFQLVPEMNIGFATGSINNGDDDTSGFHFDLGGRAGAEIDFGFIDIPRLSLQAGVGAKLAIDSVSTKDSATDVELSQSRTRIATSLNGNPWDIFTGSIAALYYF
jgi:hypothetical protein